MGQANSVYYIENINSDELLTRFIGNDKIRINDIFWKKIFSYSPKNITNFNLKIFEENINGLCKALTLNNPATGNFMTLVAFFIKKAGNYVLQPPKNIPERIAAQETLFNIMFILRCIFKYFVQSLGDESFVSQIELTDNNVQHLGILFEDSINETFSSPLPHLTVKSIFGPQADALELLRRFIACLYEIIMMPCSKIADLGSFDLVNESMVLLIILLSVQLYRTNILPAKNMLELEKQSKSTFYNLIFEELGRTQSGALMQTLLLHLTNGGHVNGESQNSNQDAQATPGAGSLILNLSSKFAAGIYGVLGSRPNSNGAQLPPFNYFSGQEKEIEQFKFITDQEITRNLADKSNLKSIFSDSSKNSEAMKFRRSSPCSIQEDIGLLWGRRCEMLLGILVTAQMRRENPYLNALSSFADETINASQFKTSSQTTDESSSNTPFTLNFNKLYTHFCDNLRHQSTKLLFYLIFHKNAHFRNYALARSDIELIIVPLLQTIYEEGTGTHNGSSHHLYMSLILCLIFTQDHLFNASIHKILIPSPIWLKERQMPQISVGSLIIVVMLRTIQNNLYRIKDAYLHTNCLAALANMSTQFAALNPYAAQRLVGFYDLLLKRYLKTYRKISHSKDCVDSGVPDSNTIMDVEVLEEILGMFLEIITFSLNSKLSSNPDLMYNLLYHRHLFSPNILPIPLPALQQSMINIEHILTAVANRLVKQESQQQTKSIITSFQLPSCVEEAMVLVKQALKTVPTDASKKSNDIKFKYEEEVDAENFFVPYNWSIICRYSCLYWDLGVIVVFDPHTYYDN